ncbi:maltokinase N-terminal cap-like domain-containing protein, partial [Clavibacter californiensis]|uniref:maltokinase N-terminal cap-like domain-containing protein n=1 Tax=Clavibacter californiensis TaxID=1401995 RepID=UPI002174D7D5
MQHHDLSEIPDFLAAWMREQRWFASKGTDPRLERIGGWSFSDEGWFARIETHLIIDHGSAKPVLYQVPLTYRQAPLEELKPFHIGTIVEDDGVELHVYDGPHDPAYAWALIRTILDDREADVDETSLGATARGQRQPGVEIATVVGSHVLSGEQSNTSIIYDMVSADGHAVNPMIVKVFRALHHGENPDVVLQSAIAGAGSRLVPQTMGSVLAEWSDSGREEGRAIGHVAFAQEFLPGVTDAWRVALRAAEADADFQAEARALGEATADVHATLAAALPTVEATPEVIEGIMVSFRRRHATAEREVPEIAAFHDAIASVYDAAEKGEWPKLQRIHGDYHLGQVLSVPNRGWVLLDFEGEPLRPMHERSLPDVTLRDVAGMLRSFDYVAGSYALAHPGKSAAAWASAARRAFVDGPLRHRPPREPRPARRVRDRQGRVRGDLRGTQPSGLAVDPAAGRRAPRHPFEHARRGDHSGRHRAARSGAAGPLTSAGTRSRGRLRPRRA